MNSELNFIFTQFSVKQPLKAETCKYVLCSGKLFFLVILQQQANQHTEQEQMFTVQHEIKLPHKKERKKRTVDIVDLEIEISFLC